MIIYNILYIKLSIYFGFLIDVIFGDPNVSWHPTRIIGNTIYSFEDKLYNHRLISNRLGGCILALTIPILTFVSAYTLIKITYSMGLYLSLISSGILISLSISLKLLLQEGNKVRDALFEKDIVKARKRLSHIVGRDTSNLSEEEIIRAVIESLSESIVDSIIAPLFYAFIGGAPLAMAYRAINTLDSMVGYKNERYHDFGWASARLDDFANFIPARISGLLIPLSAMIIKGNWALSLASVLLFGKRHPSPNSGIPEAAIAGSIGICLGGTNFYNGVPEERPLIGLSLKAIELTDISKTNRHIITATLSFLLILAIL